MSSDSWATIFCIFLVSFCVQKCFLLELTAHNKTYLHSFRIMWPRLSSLRAEILCSSLLMLIVVMYSSQVLILACLSEIFRPFVLMRFPSFLFFSAHLSNDSFPLSLLILFLIQSLLWGHYHVYSPLGGGLRSVIRTIRSLLSASASKRSHLSFSQPSPCSTIILDLFSACERY